jgi:hypothetical protein
MPAFSNLPRPKGTNPKRGLQRNKNRTPLFESPVFIIKAINAIEVAGNTEK